MASRPTIKDVAQETGYSISTISLVLNNKDVSIPKSTRDKVWAAVEKLGYRPNQLAVSMITGRTKVLGLIIPDNSNLFFAELSKAVEVAARRAGYSLIYGNTNNSPKRDYEYMCMFADRQVDGIIFTQSGSTTPEEEEKALQFVRGCDIPFITIDRHLPTTDIPSVMLNHFKGGYLATRHLVQLGHTRIGAFTGPAELASSDERLEGYRSALLEAGLTPDESLLFAGDYQLGREAEAMKHFLNQHCTAVFAFNDLMALGMYQEARSLGVRIPQDLSIVGFDNIPFSDLIQPQLTTVGQPVSEMGKCAIKVLLDMVENKQKAERHRYMFEPQLVLRASTAPPG